MKKISKLLAMLMVILTACTMLASTAFATSGGDVNNLIMPAPMTSGSDADPMLGLPTVDFDLSPYGLKISVPKLDVCLSGVSASTEGLEQIQTNAEGIVASNFLLYDMASTGNEAIYVQYSVTPYTKNIGSFNKLSETELADQLEAFTQMNCTNSSFGTLESANSEKLGSSTVLRGVFTDTTLSENDTRTDFICTIQNGVSYTILCRLDGMNSETGVQRHDDVINSIRFVTPKLGYALEGGIARNNYGINVFLLIATIILILLAAFLFFFFYRFSAFQKAAGSSFNIFGFDMPYPSDADDIYEDEDGDGFDDDHDFNDSDDQKTDIL